MNSADGKFPVHGFKYNDRYYDVDISRNQISLMNIFTGPYFYGNEEIKMTHIKYEVKAECFLFVQFLNKTTCMVSHIRIHTHLSKQIISYDF